MLTNKLDEVIDNPMYTGMTLKQLLEGKMENLNFAKNKKKESDKTKEVEKDVSDWDQQYDNASAAFLGPQLWEKTIPCHSDLKFEYMDLDEFLNENDLEDEFFKKNLALEERSAMQNQTHEVDELLPSITQGYENSQKNTSMSVVSPPIISPTESRSPDPINPSSPLTPHSPLSPVIKEEGKPVYTKGLRETRNRTYLPKIKSEVDLDCSVNDFGVAPVMGQDFDPRTRTFSEDELKPTPMVKKSRKQYVPNDLKDDKYWARRRKNNLAAKRSRDARRIKENQIALRAGYLEKENSALKVELEKTRGIVDTLKKRLASYESTNGIAATATDE